MKSTRMPGRSRRPARADPDFWDNFSVIYRTTLTKYSNADGERRFV
jgi:hypothetical protein